MNIRKALERLSVTSDDHLTLFKTMPAKLLKSRTFCIVRDLLVYGIFIVIASCITASVLGQLGYFLNSDFIGVTAAVAYLTIVFLVEIERYEIHLRNVRKKKQKAIKQLKKIIQKKFPDIDLKKDKGIVLLAAQITRRRERELGFLLSEKSLKALFLENLQHKIEERETYEKKYL